MDVFDQLRTSQVKQVMAQVSSEVSPSLPPPAQVGEGGLLGPCQVIEMYRAYHVFSKNVCIYIKQIYTYLIYLYISLYFDCGFTKNTQWESVLLYMVVASSSAA